MAIREIQPWQEANARGAMFDKLRAALDVVRGADETRLERWEKWASELRLALVGRSRVFVVLVLRDYRGSVGRARPDLGLGIRVVCQDGSTPTVELVTRGTLPEEVVAGDRPAGPWDPSNADAVEPDQVLQELWRLGSVASLDRILLVALEGLLQGVQADLVADGWLELQARVTAALEVDWCDECGDRFALAEPGHAISATGRSLCASCAPEVLGADVVADGLDAEAEAGA